MSRTRWLDRWAALWPRSRRAIRYGVVAVLLLSLLGAVWHYWLAPTRVVLVNYPDFQAARIIQARPNVLVRVQALKTEQLDSIGGYDLALVFGRGLKLGEAQLARLRAMGASDAPVYVDGATDPRHDVSNLKGADLDAVSGYLRNGGRRNYAQLLNYARRIFDGKPLFSAAVQSPEEMPRDVFFGLDETAVFTDFAAFRAWRQAQPGWQAGRPRLALLTSVPGPFNANREHVDAVIRAFEAKGFNVVPISAVGRRLALLQQVDPAAVMYMPHGRLTLGQADEAQAWLARRNVPLFAPLTIFDEQSDWERDQRSYDGGLLTMSVTLPELDGAIAPMVIAAQARDANGLKVFRALPERLARFASLVRRTVALKNTPNDQKKLAIYYYKGPGQSALTAGDLEVVPSLYALLQHLKAQGYRIEGLPDTVQGFARLLQQRGPNIGPYAKGDFAAFARHSHPALVSAAQLETWCGASIAQSLCDQAAKQFGPAPGSYLRVDDQVAVARVPLGNIVLLPQPLPGIGDDTFKLVHGTNLAPPWPYLASYLWTRNVFQADAIMHFGTHGSLEFTPWKQVGLSDHDWPDALIGQTPHIYLYTMGNVGEAIIAKRRSYATIVSHLTPAFREGGAQGGAKQLADRLQAWDHAESPALKAEYAKDTQRQAIALTLHEDLGFPADAAWSVDQLHKLADHVETLEHAKITAGLYTLGVAYALDDQRASARLMGRDALIQALAELDVARGVAVRAQLDSAAWLAEHYRGRADALITQASAAGAESAQVLARVVSDSELRRAQAWEHAQQKPSDEDLVKGFMNLGASRSSDGASQRMQAATDDGTLLRHLVRAASDPEKRAFLLALRSDKKFKQAMRTLDPQALEKARSVARAIPAMARGLDIATDSDVRALLLAMRADSARAKVLDLLNDPAILARAQKQAGQQRQALAERARAELPRLERMSGQQLAQRTASMDEAQLRDTLAAIRFWREAPTLPEDLKTRLTGALPALEGMQRELEHELEHELARREERERAFAQAVLTLRDRLAAIPGYQKLLAASPARELAALDNALAGGFTPPSSGGDPIANPDALPTGRNLFSIDAEKTPSEQAWRVGVRLADQLLAEHRAGHDGAWPRKVAFTLWAGDFIQTEGVALAQILYLLGVEPVRDPFGRIASLRLVPQAELARPRIDVVVQTSGQLRDLAASRLYLINQAVALAAGARDEDNAVAQGVRAVERELKDRGLSPMDARRFASVRVFGGVNGSYGTGIMGMVEAGDRWRDASQVAHTYLNNMGAAFGEGDLWGAFRPGVFEAALAGTDMVIQPLQSNTWGPISLDHVYEFMGGLNLAVREVTGKDPAAYFSDLRNPSRPIVREAGAAIAVEARATLLNPAYIEAMTKGGASSAETFAETFRNVYGWNVMKPSVIRPTLWDALYQTYVQDTQNLGLHAFFEKTNPYALQEMTAVMLETARKGYWQPGERVLRSVANLHADLVSRFGASGTGFVNDNRALRAFIAQQLEAAQRQPYEDSLQQANEGALIDIDKGVVLSKEGGSAGQSPAERDAGLEPSPVTKTKSAETPPAWRGPAIPASAVLGLLLMLAAVIAWVRWRHAVAGRDA
ncbi:cobaltochelatase subunit CobN [Pollutimonas sp. M17]|uniref:cobaltochelatase subunit CobN n=1 Tax=Pollutimonas sp. M17 TaxID=2962065 RepID=UPI0021F3DD7E|nr:cobaltochelatase subunit CobN [Pollutimonas sp. M17]UYO92822.1 cobaltochelatase subunit CobN [Pollutimonas sp. M17]